jgi:hypothetical protein
VWVWLCTGCFSIRASTLLTSNWPVDDWGKLLGDIAVTALLDRLLHHAHVLKCGPRSWRTKVETDLHLDGGVKVSPCRSDREKSMAPSTSTAASAEQQLAAFIRKFSPIDQRLIRAGRTALRKRFPTANELVYDNYNFFVIGYSPTERPSDAIVSMAARANGIGLCFIHGARLPDPNKVLLGSGNQTRFIRLDSPQILERPEVKALVAAAIAHARAPLPVAGRGKLIIRSVSGKQRPRRKPPRRSVTR